MAVGLFSWSFTASSQELYVFSDPASNVPAKSLCTKISIRLAENVQSGVVNQRYQPEVSVGLSKSLMARVSTTFSDQYSKNLQWESVKSYVKWRFFSRDGIHRHFRMAAFADGAFANHKMVYDEMNLDGENSGIQAGITATELVHKLAVSGTVSILRVFDERFRSDLPRSFSDQNSLNYSFSAGYLVFPRDYTSYQQVNLNLYVELLGMKGFENGGYFLDFAPAFQLIFNSATKVNLGSRFQTCANISRPAVNSWFLSVETSFLNAFHKKSSRLNP